MTGKGRQAEIRLILMQIFLIKQLFPALFRVRRMLIL
jgi:hypothetical protein